MLKLVGGAVGGAVGGVLFLLVVIGGCWVVVRWRSRKPSTPIILGVGGEEGATHIPSVSLHIEETIHPPMSSPELEGGGSEGSGSEGSGSEGSGSEGSGSEGSGSEGSGSEGSGSEGSGSEGSGSEGSGSEGSGSEGSGSEGSDSPSTASEHMDQVSDLGTRDSWAGSPIEEVELGYRILNSHSHNV